MLGKTSENGEFLTLIVFGDIDVQIWPKISRTVKKKKKHLKVNIQVQI